MRLTFVLLLLGCVSGSVLAIPARSQTATQISFTCSGQGGGDIGSCNVTPYGKMTVDLSEQLLSTDCPGAVLAIEFTLSDASGSLSAKDKGSPYGCAGSVSGTATVTGGTGIFAGATGTITYNGTDLGSDGGSLNGQGTITLPASGVSGPGGPGYPAVVCDGPGGSGYPLVIDGVMETLNICEAAAGSGEAPTIDFPAAGDIAPPVLFSGTGAPLAVINPKKQSSNQGTVTIYMGVPPILSSTTIYVAVVSCGNAPSTLTVNTCWIVINAPNATTVAANTGAALPAVVNPQSLVGGYYNATVSITANNSSSSAQAQEASPKAAAGSSTVNIPVAMLVTSAPLLSLSQTALRFQATSGTGGAMAQNISISDANGGNLSFATAVSMLSGGNWLSVTDTASQIQVQANPVGLGAGTYYGRVAVTEEGAVNSPQSVEVVMTVAAPSASVSPVVSPAGLIFVAKAGASAASQTIQVFNSSSQTLTLSTQAESGNASWFSATASAATAASGQALAETVSVNANGLAAGVYRGTLNVNAAETHSTYSVAIVLVVTPATGVCMPSQLAPVFTSLANQFQIPGGVPAVVEANVVDDCGTPLTSGSVVAYFPDGDPSVSLAPLGNGAWSGTWLPHKISGGTATAGLIASSGTAGVYGTTAVAGSVTANNSVPVIAAGGAVNAASLAANAPLAPGSYISVFGSNLASGSNAADKLPFPPTLGATQVLLGTEPLPLQYAGSGQINAVIPYDAPVNSVQQLIVENGAAYSLPETVTIVPAQPAIFTQSQSGTGPGAIMVAKADGTQFLNTSSNPATAGDALVIYCTGLGAVSPAVGAGTSAPSSPPAQTVNPVTVTIGGKAVQPFFAGLTPGYAGLYQVNVTLPDGIAAGSAVPLVISAAGASSREVTVAIQ